MSLSQKPHRSIRMEQSAETAELSTSAAKQELSQMSTTHGNEDVSRFLRISELTFNWGMISISGEICLILSTNVAKRHYEQTTSSMQTQITHKDQFRSGSHGATVELWGNVSALTRHPADHKMG